MNGEADHLSLQLLAERLAQSEIRRELQLLHATDAHNALEERIHQRFKTEELLRDKLETSMNNRLDQLNIFREQLNRQSAMFVTWWSLLTVSTAIAGGMVGLFEFLQKIVPH